MPARRLALAIALLVATGCGRSSFLGTSPYDCPADQFNADGTCGRHDDLGRPDGGHDLRDGGHDLRDAGSCSPELITFCANDMCQDPACCDCQLCAFTPQCQFHHDMGPDAHDAGDFCADPSHCKDPRCVGDPRCHVIGTEICNNGIDDNDNGLIDCADPQCFNFPGCQMHRCTMPPDCTDPQCNMVPACQDLTCHPSVDFGSISPMNSSSTRMVNTKGTTDQSTTPCAPGGGGMVVGKFTLTSGPAAVTLTFSQGAGEDQVFGIFQAGINQACGANPIANACYDPKGATSGSHTYLINTPGEYYVIVQSYEVAGQGPATVTLSTGHTQEICNNGIDDNANGLIDCADPDCFKDPNCVTQECRADFNVGALVVNAPGQSVSFDTSTADVENSIPTCQAQPGGKDVVVRFTLRETAGILLNWDQTGDHVVALAHTPQPGSKCDAQEIGCYDPSARPQDTVAWGEFPPGDYEFIFKATRPGAEGHIDATLSAYRNRRIEICHNGIDDDNNGLIDCADPACFGVAGCTGPYCMPNVDLGSLSIGQSGQAMLNIAQNGVAGYNASCAKGGGKGMVVKVTVPSGGTNGGVGLTFSCTQTGDQVLDLFPAGGPRDTCDAQQSQQTCADPKTLPFGCGFEIPNLQPGVYDVVVEAFAAGTEGTMDLTVGVVDDRQLEICNNGIDDDMNGLTDCADPKCATSPYCATTQCHPDQSIDPVPLTGAAATRLLQTSANGVHAKVPCATTSGGQTATLFLRLTAAADLTIAWNQLGNHDFVLYNDVSAMLACDAGNSLSCQKSNGVGMGSFKLTNVPVGNYYLVVAGDQPDGATQFSGAVNISISGTPH